MIFVSVLYTLSIGMSSEDLHAGMTNVIWNRAAQWFG